MTSGSPAAAVGERVGERGEPGEIPAARPAASVAPPRLGFLGVGWIGRSRMEAVAGAGAARVVAVADPEAPARNAAVEVAPEAEAVSTYEELLERELDGVVIATPSAAHAEQSIAALERGFAVFCQKPLARNAEEARQVVAAARQADRLLDVDLCYRRTAAMQAIRLLVAGGDLGRIYSADLTFHNAYGPDKEWFYDRARSGGGCLMDLGIHLIDLALWVLDFPDLEGVHARLHHDGRRIGPGEGAAEDHALATLDLAGGATVRIACSWNLPAGKDARIEAAFYGTEGGAALRNVDGSFYDFTADRLRGTHTERLVEPPDAWGGRTITAWAERLARDPGFDPRIEEAVVVAEVLDRLYRECAS